VDFFAAGLIDSFGVIELLSAVEEHFAIHFSDLHFQDRRFPFVGGLADIIREIREQEGHGR
jgi:acyl carrier protein